MIYLICFCLLLDAIFVLYLYNKTDNFIVKQSKEAIEIEKKHNTFHRYWNDRKKNGVKKDRMFDNLKRKMGS